MLEIGVGTSFQLLPASTLYSHLPFPLVRLVIAMPSSAAPSRSLIDEPTIVETSAPALPVSSSVMVERVGALGMSTGASFVAMIVRVAVSLTMLMAVVPPLAAASKPVSPLLPLV